MEFVVKMDTASRLGSVLLEGVSVDRWLKFIPHFHLNFNGALAHANTGALEQPLFLFVFPIHYIYYMPAF